MGKWSQYELKDEPKASGSSKWDQYAAPEAAPSTKTEPGWFEPGSKSEAALRGFSQGATLGFGDEISALVRRFSPEALGGAPAGQTYEQLRDAERAANANAASKNTGSYIAGNIAAALPSSAAAITKGSVGALSALKGTKDAASASIPRIAARSGALGGVSGLGAGEGDLGDQLTSAGTSAALGAAIPAATMGAARTARSVGSTIAGTSKTSGAPARAILSEEQQRNKDAVAGGLLGGVSALASGHDITSGALAGASAGYLGVPRSGIVKSGANVARGIANRSAKVISTGSLGASQAMQSALAQMSGQQARSIVQQKDAQIQQEVASGRPEYAAKFSALQDPAYRVAESKSTDPQDDDDDEEFESED